MDYQKIYRIMGHDMSQYYNFSGGIFLVAEHIVAIYKLKDGSERERLLR